MDGATAVVRWPPPPRRGAVIVESGVFAVPSKAPHEDAAKKALGSWLDPKVQKAWIGHINDISANPKVEIENPLLKSITDHVAAAEPIELERCWEASPPALVEGHVQDLAAFMVNPTKAEIEPTLQRMQKRAETEWAAWTGQE